MPKGDFEYCLTRLFPSDEIEAESVGKRKGGRSKSHKEYRPSLSVHL